MRLTEILSKYFKGDRVIWGVIFALSMFSLLAVYSSTGTLAYKYQGGNTAYYILKHFVLLMVGLGIIYITHLIPYKFYSKLSQLFLYLAIFLLAITLIMGTSLNQATRWLTLPGLGITIQTSDFAKLALIMYIARILSMRQHKIDDFNGIVVSLIIPVVAVCGLIMPANLSTAVILFATSFILMFIGRVKMRYLLLVAGIGIFIVTLLIASIVFTGSEGRVGTWQNRIESFVSGDSDGNYQVEQSKIAIATGGFFGKGPGNSTQRNFLPHPYSDFIYAIIIEEYGFLGGVLVLILYMFLLYRAGVIVRKSNRTFAAFLAIGLTIGLTFQAMINMGVAVHLFPVTGQTLPLVSMGGSSILFTGVALGIILSVSRSVDKNIEVETESADESEPDEA
ncbi:MAG: putative peptidoglycan glycosyltransferase FtsW [Bacteroidales bacterium]|jgi:cell division protein FtsW|nr:putative peptidoglycan glycosyltransferase FtsW [Bacteroidales bacterium]